MNKIRHPAKFTDEFIPIFADILKTCNNVIDPMCGTGKIGLIKQYGFNGIIYANELEIEWLQQAIDNGCDIISSDDASNMRYSDRSFDAICTSPTYGNRMADHHNAKDNSKRNTYTHTIGRKLSEENTGNMQWGERYRQKHIDIYKEFYRILKSEGIFILNIKDHIRKGKIINVSEFHKNTIIDIGFTLIKEMKIEVDGLKFGTNYEKRIEYENIFVFKKILK